MVKREMLDERKLGLSPLAEQSHRSKGLNEQAAQARQLVPPKMSLPEFLIHNLTPGAGFSLTENELTALAPYLLDSGAGALGWQAIANTALGDTPIAYELHQAYRLHTLQAAVHERELSQLFSFLHQNHFAPLLGKGWAIARHYPEAGLRPYGDFDLYARPSEYEALQAALASQAWNTDLHYAVPEMPDRDYEAMHAHSQLIMCQGVNVRVFSSEDHLRLLCLHMLREGVLRPLWLFDLAIALHALPTDFDWDYFLSGDSRRSDWAVCALGLAHELLGADVTGLPIEARAKNLPRWLVPEVLREWGTGKVTHGRRAPIASQLRNPRAFWAALKERWPNKIEASYRVNAPFNNFPRLPFQLRECGQRVLGFARQVPRLWHNEPVIMK